MIQKQNKRDIKKFRKSLKNKQRSNQRTIGLPKRNTDTISSVVLTEENEINDYFNQMKLVNDESWKKTFEMMVKTNVDLTFTTKPLLDTTYKSMMCGKKIRLVIIDDVRIIKVVVKGRNPLPDVLLQIWDVTGYKSMMVGGSIREDSDINWRGERLPLTKSEKVLTSWLLNSHENGGYGHPIVVDDIVKSVSDKNLFHNVFSVLN
jgi:hypothetical protein